MRKPHSDKDLEFSKPVLTLLEFISAWTDWKIESEIDIKGILRESMKLYGSKPVISGLERLAELGLIIEKEKPFLIIELSFKGRMLIEEINNKQQRTTE